MTLYAGNWRTYNQNAKGIVAMLLNKLQPKDKEAEARQLKNLQTEVQGSWTKALGEFAAQWSRKLKKGNWRIHKPYFKEIAARQLKNLQPKGQGNCNTTNE